MPFAKGSKMAEGSDRQFWWDAFTPDLSEDPPRRVLLREAPDVDVSAAFKRMRLGTEGDPELKQWLRGGKDAPDGAEDARVGALKELSRVQSLIATLLMPELARRLKEDLKSEYQLVPKRLLNVWTGLAALLAVVGISWGTVVVTLKNTAVQLATERAEVAAQKAEKYTTSLIAEKYIPEIKTNQITVVNPKPGPNGDSETRISWGDVVVTRGGGVVSMGIYRGRPNLSVSEGEKRWTRYHDKPDASAGVEK
jgi:hypothetical protein